MGISRRTFLKCTAAIAGSSVLNGSSQALAGQTAQNQNKNERYGVLVDTTLCNGCRKCEWACNEWNKNPNQPLKAFEDHSVFNRQRRTHASCFTVVNRFFTRKDSSPVYVKKQCMHCEEPACLSACFVDAFKKTEKGAVIYNPNVCVGCRYCMIACPFDIPAYEYDEPINPRVTKCTFCFERISAEGKVPACVEVCPTETLRFGKREDLINLGHDRIRDNPGKYIDHVYGEHEVGGTSWLYLSSVPFERIGFRTDLGDKPIPHLSKGFLFVTKVFEIAAAWPLVFAAYCAISKARSKRREDDSGKAGKKGTGDGQKT
jgi:Fe-S-cluster-containing dehydrogenase component